jgi:hypothetical protein
MQQFLCLNTSHTPEETVPVIHTNNVSNSRSPGSRYRAWPRAGRPTGRSSIRVPVVSRIPALGHTLLSTQWVQGTLSLGVK